MKVYVTFADFNLMKEFAWEPWSMDEKILVLLFSEKENSICFPLEKHLLLIYLFFFFFIKNGWVMHPRDMFRDWKEMKEVLLIFSLDFD